MGRENPGAPFSGWDAARLSTPPAVGNASRLGNAMAFRRRWSVAPPERPASPFRNAATAARRASLRRNPRAEKGLRQFLVRANLAATGRHKACFIARSVTLNSATSPIWNTHDAPRRRNQRHRRSRRVSAALAVAAGRNPRGVVLPIARLAGALLATLRREPTAAGAGGAGRRRDAGDRAAGRPHRNDQARPRSGLDLSARRLGHVLRPNRFAADGDLGLCHAVSARPVPRLGSARFALGGPRRRGPRPHAKRLAARRLAASRTSRRPTSGDRFRLRLAGVLVGPRTSLAEQRRPLRKEAGVRRRGALRALSPRRRRVWRRRSSLGSLRSLRSGRPQQLAGIVEDRHHAEPRLGPLVS